MPDLEFFDANCAMGRSSHPAPRSLHSPEAVTQAARVLGITARLVYHTHAREWAPEVGNDALVPWLDVAAGTYGCWVVDPIDFGDAEETNIRMNNMASRGFRAVRLCPDATAHNFRIDAVSQGALFSALEHRRWPAIIETAEPQWGAIDALLTAYPQLPVILSGFAYRHARSLYPLLQRHASLRVETSTFVAFDAVEDVVERFGEGALVFGTNAPHYAMGAAVARIELAELSASARAAIAFDNLFRMISDAEAS